MAFQIGKHGDDRFKVEPDFEQVSDDTIIGSSAWSRAGGRRQERFQVVTMRDGKIADLQGFSSRRQAERFARRRRA